MTITRPVKYDIQTADVPFEDRSVDIHGIVDAHGEMILRAEEINEADLEEVAQAINAYKPTDPTSGKPE